MLRQHSFWRCLKSEAHKMLHLNSLNANCGETRAIKTDMHIQANSIPDTAFIIIFFNYANLEESEKTIYDLFL